MAKLTNKESEDIKKKLLEEFEIREKLNSSVTEYAKSLEKIGNLQKNINTATAQEQKIQDSLNENVKKRRDYRAGILNLTTDEFNELKKKIRAEKISLDIVKEENNKLKDRLEIYKRQAKEVNKLALGAKSIGKALAATPGLIKAGFGKLESFGLFKMDKAIRNARLEMGIFSQQGDAFYNSIQNAAQSTLQLGVGVEDLVKLQTDYSNQSGRALTFNKANADSIAELAKGTMLGVDGAGAFAGEMEGLGISINETKGFIEDTVNLSHEMGLNTSAVVKNIQNNLKLANKYNFKNGIKGLAHMAQLSTKFKIDMSSVAGMSDKLFDIEGAVDMSAQLQVLGGEWAKLADPFKLMYQAREDMDGLFESVVNATKGSASFVKETGEFKLSGLSMHRLKVAADAAGLSVEELVSASKQAAKYSKIKGEFNIAMPNDETADFISSIAQYDKTKGQYYINLSDGKGGTITKFVDELGSFDGATMKNIKAMMTQKQTLKEQAKNAQNFDDAFNNTMIMFKTALLPIIESINTKLFPAIQTFQQTVKTSGWIESIQNFAKTIGSIVGTVGKWMIEWPKTTIALGLLLGPAKWFSNGVSMGMGFNSVTGGKNGLIGLLKNILTPFGGGTATANGFASGGSRLLGAAGIGAAGAVGGNYVGSKLAGSDTGGGDIGSIVGTVAGGAIGTALGGPVGLAIGMSIGSAAGKYFGEKLNEDKQEAKPVNNLSNIPHVPDGIIRPNGKVQAITSENDAKIALQKNGPLANVLGSNNNSSMSNKMELSFNPLKIEFGELKLTTQLGSKSINILDDDLFIRDLSKMVQEELRKAINGGKLSPKPIKSS